MRFKSAVILAGLVASPGLAWGAMPTDDEITVNPPSSGQGGTLLYPGGQYMRAVRPLLQPGEKRDTGPIQLHMPVKRAPSAAPSRPKEAAAPAPKRAVAAAPAPRRTVAAAPKPAPKPASKPAPAKQTAAAAPPPAPTSSSGYKPSYSIFAAPPGTGLLSEAPQSAPAQNQQPKQQTARAEPPPASTASRDASMAGLIKRSVILFSAGATDPASKALDSIKFLAGDLNAAMVNSGSRIQLLAYGGDKGDKGSDARRLSLKRALSIRQVLIDDGVPSERIDVRAMGGADDGGPADRVDVFVKA